MAQQDCIIARFPWVTCSTNCSTSMEANMKKRIYFSSLLLLNSVPLTTMAASPTCADPKGAWANELMSTLNISTIDATSGMLQGTYSSPSGTSGQEFKLVGWVNHAQPRPDKDNVKVISFSVHWGQYGSVTSWSGYCTDINGVPTIKTIWNLVRPNSDFTWDHVLTNSDTFTPKDKKPMADNKNRGKE